MSSFVGNGDGQIPAGTQIAREGTLTGYKVVFEVLAQSDDFQARIY
jgi:hypothetical protein